MSGQRLLVWYLVRHSRVMTCCHLCQEALLMCSTVLLLFMPISFLKCQLLSMAVCCSLFSIPFNLLGSGLDSCIWYSGQGTRQATQHGAAGSCALFLDFFHINHAAAEWSICQEYRPSCLQLSVPIFCLYNFNGEGALTGTLNF